MRAVRVAGLRHTDPEGRALHLSVSAAVLQPPHRDGPLRLGPGHPPPAPPWRSGPARIRPPDGARPRPSPWRRHRSVRCGLTQAQQPLPVLRPADPAVSARRTRRCGGRGGRMGPLPRARRNGTSARAHDGGRAAQPLPRRPRHRELPLGARGSVRRGRHRPPGSGTRPAGRPGTAPHARLHRATPCRQASRPPLRGNPRHRPADHRARLPHRLVAGRTGHGVCPLGRHSPTGCAPRSCARRWSGPTFASP